MGDVLKKVPVREQEPKVRAFVHRNHSVKVNVSEELKVNLFQ